MLPRCVVVGEDQLLKAGAEGVDVEHPVGGVIDVLPHLADVFSVPTR